MRVACAEYIRFLRIPLEIRQLIAPAFVFQAGSQIVVAQKPLFVLQRLRRTWWSAKPIGNNRQGIGFLCAKPNQT
jgi:hypothetical protein